jgi:hypothetical protein
MKSIEELETEPLTEPIDLTENALASEFTRRYRDDLRYVHEWGKWLPWDGRRWAFERTLAGYDLARKLVRERRLANGELIGVPALPRTTSGRLTIAEAARRMARHRLG